MKLYLLTLIFILATALNAGAQVVLDSDVDNRLVVNPFGSHVSSFVQGCGTTTGTSDTEILPAAGSGVSLYVTTITCSNKLTVNSLVTFKDGSSAIWTGYARGASDPVVINFATPLKGSTNTAFNFAMEQASTSTTCCATGFKSVN